MSREKRAATGCVGDAQREAKRFRALVRWLYERAAGEWAGAQPPDEIVRRHGSQVTPEDLERCLPSSVALDSALEDHFVIALPKARNGTIPVLKFDACFSPSLPQVSLQLALYRCAEGGNGGWRAVGLRFESPEGTGRHGFLHCQWIRHFRRDGADFPGCPDWLPDAEPTLPLAARRAYQLPLCLAVSLYGLDVVKEMYQDSDLRDWLGQALLETGLVEWPEDFFEIRDASSRGTYRASRYPEGATWTCSDIKRELGAGGRLTKRTKVTKLTHGSADAPLFRYGKLTD